MDLFHGLHHRLELTIVLASHTIQLVSTGMRKIEMTNGKILNN